MNEKHGGAATIEQCKEALLGYIDEVVGVAIKPEGRLIQSIDLFIDYLKEKEIFLLEQVDKNILGRYRILLRIHANRDDETPLVSAVASFLSVGVFKGWLPNESYLFWQHIEDSDYFTKRHPGMDQFHQIGGNHENTEL